jgi:acyl-CoA thioester hydrolase
LFITENISNILNWKNELLRSCGLAYSQVENQGYHLPLLEAGIKYHSPGKYDDILLIEARVNELYSSKVHIEYKITRVGTANLLQKVLLHIFLLEATRKKLYDLLKFILIR